MSIPVRISVRGPLGWRHVTLADGAADTTGRALQLLATRGEGLDADVVEGLRAVGKAIEEVFGS